MLTENGYTLKFTPGTDQAVAAVYVNNQALPLSNIKNNTYEVSGITGMQDIRVIFSPISKPGNMNWKRSDSSSHNASGSSTDTTHVLKGNKNLNFTWSDLNKLTLTNTQNVWDNGDFYSPYKGAQDVEPYATWRYLSGDGNYELRRFQTTFTIPEGCSTADYVRLKSVHADKYGDYNDGNIIPINDDIFIFIYSVNDKDKITNDNYMKYLAFWTGTISQDNNAKFHGVEGTTPYQDKVNTPFQKYTDGWYCEADLDNVGSMLFKNYPNGMAGDQFVLDVFVGDYSTGGGMDPLELEFVKTTGSPVTIHYYKDQITTPDDNTHFLGTETIKGLMLGQEIDLSSYGDGSYLNEYKPNTGNYLDGAQSPLPYIVKEEAGVINVLYVTQKQPVKVKYYARDNESIQEDNWTLLGVLQEQQFPLGWKYEDAVYKEYGKNTWLTETERDWYDDGFVKDGTAEITKDTNVIKVVYTKKYGDFQITKVLQGNTQSNVVSNVQFQLYKSDASWSASELYGNPVNAVQSVDVTTGTVDFTKIPGGYYILEETQTAPGYNALTFGIRLQITLDDNKNVVCKFCDSEGTEIIQNGKYYGNAVEMKEGKMIIYNKAGAILPDTGGQGLDSIHRLGWSVILTSVIFAGFQLSQTIKRKREE